MKIGMSILVLFGVAISALAAESQTGWSRFRGAAGSGVAAEQRPPVEFGPEKNLKWKVAVPSGMSSPIVVGDKLVLTAFDGGKLYTIAYLRATGKEIWRAEAEVKELEKYHKTEGSPAASTPVSDGQRIISYFGSCGLSCYDLSGKKMWSVAMPPASIPGNFGSGVSPILVDGTVILVRDQMKNSKIYAFDAVTGSPVWEKERHSPVSYSTPVCWETSSGKQIVVAGHARLIGYDLKSGAEKWSVTDIPSSCCSSPVIGADGILYFAGSSPGGPDDAENQVPNFDAMLANLDADKDGALSRPEAEKAFEGFFDSQDMNRDGKITRDEWDVIIKFMSEGKNCAFALKSGGTGELAGQAHVLWRQTKGLPYVASAILAGGHYVMVKDGGIVTALDAKSGAPLYQKRVAATGKYYASPVAANGNIYFTSLQGAVTVVKAGSTEPVVVATNSELGDRTAATPAIADNTLYVRTDKHLYAFGETK